MSRKNGDGMSSLCKCAANAENWVFDLVTGSSPSRLEAFALFRVPAMLAISRRTQTENKGVRLQQINKGDMGSHL
jgi:hypothetical protein